MSRPSLHVLTTYFDDSDRHEATDLGNQLYNLLTRPLDDPLAVGPGIPVSVAVHPNCVDVHCAERVVVIPVLGKEAFVANLSEKLDQINSWHEQLPNGKVVCVPKSQNWRDAERNLPGALMLFSLYGEGDKAVTTLREIVLAISRVVQTEKNRPVLFLSHAKADLAATEDAVNRIASFVKSDTTADAFFDRIDLTVGTPIKASLEWALQGGVFVALRTDSYSSRVWCQHELLSAKLNRLPTLTVELLRKGEVRTTPYGGNGPSLVWDDDPAVVVLRAAVEWLRHQFFQHEGKRVAQAAKLPDVDVLSRPPELLDFAQGPLSPERTQVVLHPDPELPASERQILRAACPRLRLTTPSTVFRRFLQKESGARAPLEGYQVAMSLSDSPDANGHLGYTAEHVRDATVYLARNLISAGATIAYGGDFRENGFTPLLSELIVAYNRTADHQARNLVSYLGASIKTQEMPEELVIQRQHLLCDEPAKSKSRLRQSVENDAEVSKFFHFSDMRGVMADLTHARILIGGQVKPILEDDSNHGYGGRYPGVVQEAWWTLRSGKPLYVVGGFGGAAAIVADILEGKQTPDRLKDEYWKGARFDKLRERLDDPANDRWRELLGIPKTMKDLADSLREASSRLWASDDDSMSHNGLSVEENLRLFRSRDPVEIATLVLEGLLRWTQNKRREALRIELVLANLVDAAELHAITVALFDDVPLGGAAAALDDITGELASRGRADGQTLISLSDTRVDADWLYLASLGKLGDLTSLEKRVEAAARTASEMARRYGLQKIGTVTFGGSITRNQQSVVDAMVQGFRSLPENASLTWFESDPDRFEKLHEILKGWGTKVAVTTHRPALGPREQAKGERCLFLHVVHSGDQLVTTLLPPDRTSVAEHRTTKLSEQDVIQLAWGSGDGRNSLRLNELESRSLKVADSLLGPEAVAIIGRAKAERVVVVHDRSASRIPFETLLHLPGLADVRLFQRTLLTSELSVDRIYRRPPKSEALKVLLVVNPTKDLPGAKEEGERAMEILHDRSGIHLCHLYGDDVTCDRFLSELADADVLHYCGHGFYSGSGFEESGLVLADNRLTLRQLRDVQTVPRFAFLNGCELIRLRAEAGNAVDPAVSFAEYFLRAGTEAYIGAFWRVGDAAAKLFSESLYSSLLSGDSLGHAVGISRQKLRDKSHSDWVNYQLYGDGEITLKRSE